MIYALFKPRGGFSVLVGCNSEREPLQCLLSLQNTDEPGRHYEQSGAQGNRFVQAIGRINKDGSARLL